MSPSPRFWHQKITLNLASLIREHLRKHKGTGEVAISPSDVELSAADVYQPDIYFIAQERLGILNEQGPGGAPDLVVEVLSPGTAKLDLGPKREVYGASGVKEMWIVDGRAKKIDLYLLEGSELKLARSIVPGEQIATPLIPDLLLDVREIFES